MVSIDVPADTPEAAVQIMESINKRIVRDQKPSGASFLIQGTPTGALKHDPTKPRFVLS